MKEKRVPPISFELSSSCRFRIPVVALLAIPTLLGAASSAEAASKFPHSAAELGVYGPILTPRPGAKAPVVAPLEPKTLVQDIEVHGNRRIGSDRILLVVPFSMGDLVTRTQVLDAIQRIYGLGFFQDVKADPQPAGGGIRLIFNVVENPVLKAVSFDGVSMVPQEKLQALFAPMVGDIINYNTIKEAVEKVQKTYVDAGYPLGHVFDLKVAPGGVLDLSVAEGKIHDVSVRGNEETKKYVIMRELTEKPGMVLQADKLRADRLRLTNLNYFEDVAPRIEPAPSPQEIDLVWEVKEKQTGSINLGAGYSTTQGILGMLSVKKDNILGTGQQAGADISISQNWQLTGAINYFNPWFDNQRTGLGGSLYYQRFNNYLGDFRQDSIGGSANASKPLFGDPITTPWRGTAGLKLESDSTFDNVYVGGNSKPIGDNGQALTLSPSGTDRSVGVSGGISFDTRDLVLDPTEGWFTTLSLEPTLINGSAPLLKGTGEVDKFFPLPAMPWAPDQKTTLAFGTRFGLIGAPQVPGYDRFYATGPYLIRGWPEFVTPGSPIATKYPLNYFQGSNAFVGSVEYRFPIFSVVTGVLFGDTGIFWDNSSFNTNLLHSGYGAGVRLNTPLGPIRLDYGMSGTEPGQFHFSIGQKF
jgi:outer membrane protein insertion porin family